MTRKRPWAGLLVALAVLAFCVLAAAAKEDDHAAHDAEHGKHGAGHDGDGEAHDDVHGAGHDDHGPGEVNWFYGMLGERPDVEPSALWRPVGMPAPYGAMLLNTSILFFVLYRVGSKKVSEGLKERKRSILKGFEEAGQMKQAATTRLADYEQKLDSIDQEIERVRVQMREAAEIERKRVLQEAKERRERMERDARILVEQELKAAREQLIQETARVSLESAQKLIVAQLTAGDKERLLQEYLTSVVGKVGPSSNGAARAQGGPA